jgi:hypothetical protein
VTQILRTDDNGGCSHSSPTADTFPLNSLPPYVCVLIQMFGTLTALQVGGKQQRVPQRADGYQLEPARGR